MPKLKKQAELADELQKNIEAAEKRIAIRDFQRDSLRQEYATKMSQLDEGDKIDRATIENANKYLG